SSMKETAEQVVALPGNLVSAQQNMAQAAIKLTEAANKARARLVRCLGQFDGGLRHILLCAHQIARQGHHLLRG
ncbi:hypothetical protein, partial [Aeromonas caviae]|uniref:hypothetical protein n=1 Tax=Aeromonas caviae TaxID=648 RepID=UPI001FC8246E